MERIGLGDVTEKQEKAIIALLNEPTIGRAAIAAGCGERTLHRWLRDPTFTRAYCQARRQAFSVAVSLSQKYAPMAVQTLARIMNNEAAPYATRVAAAATILRHGRDAIELEDIAARVDALEQAQDAPSKRVVADSPAPIEDEPGSAEE